VSTRRLWVIDPSVNHPEDEGVRNVIGDWSGETRVFRPVLSAGEGPDENTGYDVDAVALLGSASSVYDPLPWYAPLAAWLAPILKGEVPVPVLGICFGHQMMAHCAGGEVGYLTPEQDKQVTVETTRLEGARLLPGRHDLRVAVSHNEEVKRLPPGYQAIASRGAVAIDGMQHQTLPLFSFQFHPEAGEDFARTSGIDAAAMDSRQREDSDRLLRAFRAFAQ
jgi:GMP synthase-like glutamine amidotransferase